MHEITAAKKKKKLIEEYWLKRLHGVLPKVSLPRFSRPGPGTEPVKTLFLEIPVDTWQNLEKMSKGSDIALFILFLSGLKIALSKYTGVKDLVIGSSTPKNQENHHELILLRNFLEDRFTVRELISRVKQSVLEAFNHGEYSFVDIYERLKARQEDSLDIFNIAFIYDRLQEKPEAFERFELVFILTAAQSQVGLKVQYNPSLDSGEMVQRFCKNLLNIFADFPGKIETKLSGIDILTPGEKKQVLFDFNDTDAEYPAGKTLHELFREQAEKVPDHIALVGIHETHEKREKNYNMPNLSYMSHLSYKKLNEKAHGLAQLLKERGVGADTIVGLMVERSIEMIIGILGILKAGGAYLPIDPAYPEERRCYMLSESGARILLTRQEVAALSLPEAFNIRPRGAFFHLHLSPWVNAPATSLAYIIYTSGTTGKPRGNLTTHRNAVRVVRNTNYIDITGQDRILQLSNYAFDGSIFDIYGALLNGAVLVMISEEDVLSMDKLPEVIKREAITVFFVTTALFNVLVEEKIDCLQNVRKVLFGGERVSVVHSRKALEYLGKERIIHVYGPTETTVYATYYNINHISANPLTIPIGRPIANTVVYILDKYLAPVPVMVYGEIYIGGPGVCRGYLNNPELTAESFLATEDTEVTEGHNKKLLQGVQGGGFLEKSPPGRRRLYKTGDLARWLVGGDIEFLGRVDHQVKIRGFRIEPGEIENRLLKHPEVKEAVVMVIEIREGEKSLAAYVVIGSPAAGDTGKTGELREYLAKHLPDFMIPAFFVLLEKIPLTPNGKVDSKALPQPGLEPHDRPVFTAPRNPVEEKLAGLWADILGIETGTISIDDNFFKLGGHSLRAVKLVSRIHKTFNTHIPMNQLFKIATIRELSGHIRGAVKDMYASPTPAEKKEYYPLSSIQRRLFILYQVGEVKTAYNLPSVLIVEAEAGIDHQLFQQVFQQLIKRHESLRTSFTIVEGEPRQIIHDEVDFSVEYKEASQGEIPRFIEEFITPFDLNEAPLLRATMVKLSGEKYLFLYDMHHIISDGTSIGIFLKDFMCLYRGEELAPLAFQYKDFSEWQNSDDESTRKILKKKEEYWLHRFQGEIPRLNIHTDFPRPSVQSFAGDQVRFTFDKELLRKIQQLRKETETTLYMVLLAFYTILLARYTGQEDIIVGTPAAGREHVEFENVIGLFINALPMRNFPQGHKTFKEFLNQVKINTIEAYENQGYPFGDLVEKVAEIDDLSRNPIFETELLVQNLDIPDWKIENLTFTPYEYVYPATQMDIALEAEEAEGMIYFVLRYCIDLFKRTTMEKFVDFFKEIVSAVLDNPDIRLQDLKISHHLLSLESKVYQDTQMDFEF